MGLGELSHPTIDTSVKNKMKENDANFIWLIILESKLEVNLFSKLQEGNFLAANAA